MKIVKVTFNNRNQTYSYLVPDRDDPKIGDVVITSMTRDQSNYAWENGYDIDVKAARVLNVLEENDGKASRFYIQLLSKEEITRRQGEQLAQMEKERKRKALMTKMDEILKATSKVDMFRKAAESNPEIAALLRELDANS